MNPANTPAGVTAPPGGFQNGGWYGGQQFWNGSFGAANVINNPNQQGYGQAVSQEVVAQTNPNNVAYLQGKGAAVPAANDTSNPGFGAVAGGMGGAAMAGQPTIPNLSSIYAQSYTNNPEVQAAQAKLTQMGTDYSSATKDINDNPFFAEATRTGKLAKLDSQYNSDTATQQNVITNAQAEAQRQVSLAQGQYSMDNQAWQQNISEFNNLVSQGALDNADPAAIAQMSVATGLPASVLSNIAGAQSAKYTQLITSTDNSGNVTISAVNSKTGKIINTTSLGAVGAAKTGGAGGKADTNGMTKNDYLSYLLGDISNGADLKSLVQHYQQYLPIATIYSQYGSNSPYGAPKETLAQIKSGQFADQKGFTSKAKPTIN